MWGLNLIEVLLISVMFYITVMISRLLDRLADMHTTTIQVLIDKDKEIIRLKNIIKDIRNNDKSTNT